MDSSNNRLYGEDIAAYVRAGNATVTLRSENSGRHYTYRLKLASATAKRYDVSCLVGPDNRSDYRYIGSWYTKPNVLIAERSWSQAEPTRVMDWFLRHLRNIPPELQVFHEGRCGRCGRKLTTPASLASGLGPRCKEVSPW